MILEFDNNDIFEHVTPEEKNILNGKKAKGTLGPHLTVPRIIARAIKKSITSLGKKMEDEHSTLDQITLKMEITGKPFNVGLGGSVEYTFKINRIS